MNSGYLDAFLYSLFTAISFNFIDNLDDHINPFISLLFMTVVASLFFNAITYKHIGKMWQGIRDNKLIFFLMSICISINWLCSIFAPNLSDPFIYLTLSFVTIAILGYIFVRKETKIDYYVDYLAVTILVISLYIIYLKYTIGQNRNLNFGFYIGSISGVMGYAYGYFLNKFVKKTALTTNQTLSIRFFFLMIILISTILERKITIHISWSDFKLLLFMSVFVMIIPNYLNQSSIIKLGVAKRAVFVSIVPFISFVIYSIFSKSFNLSNFILAFTMTIILIMSKIISYKKVNKGR